MKGPIVVHRVFCFRAERPAWPGFAGALLSLLAFIASAGTLAAQSADLQLGASVSALRVPAGEEVTVSAGVTNAGPSDATGVTLTATLAPRSGVVSTTPNSGSCTLADGVVTCQFGTLAPGAVASVNIKVHTAAGANPCLLSVRAAEPDPNSADNTTQVSTLGYATQVWTNPDATLLPDEFEGPADIYPLNIVVSGQTSRIDKVTVTLHNLTHEWPDDFDILLVGPGGQKVFLMSDCGLDNYMGDVTLTFDDDAAENLPNSDPGIVTGTYRPTNFDRLSDLLDPPAPREPYSTNLAVFRGTVANGTWSLYLYDDSPENQGYLTDGWSLTFDLVDPEADVRLSATGPLGPVRAGRSVLYEVAVTNAGPASSATMVRHELPPGFRLSNAVASQGGCTLAGNVVSCALGDLAAGGRASVIFDLMPLNGGTFTNRIQVLTPLVDPNTSNNATNYVTTVQAVSDLILVSPSPDTEIEIGQTVVTQFAISNAGPSLTPVVMSMIVTPGLSIVASSSSVGACVNLEGTVACDFGILPAGGVASVQVTSRGTAVGESRAVTRLDGTALDLNTANNTVINNVRILPGVVEAPNISAIDRVPTGVAVSFSSALGRRYTLEYNDALGGGTWRALGSLDGSGAVATLIDTNAIPFSRFYRVRAQ